MYYVSTEDASEDTALPRFIRFGGDNNRYYDNDEKECHFELTEECFEEVYKEGHPNYGNAHRCFFTLTYFIDHLPIQCISTPYALNNTGTGFFTCAHPSFMVSYSHNSLSEVTAQYENLQDYGGLHSFKKLHGGLVIPT